MYWDILLEYTLQMIMMELPLILLPLYVADGCTMKKFQIIL